MKELEALHAHEVVSVPGSSPGAEWRWVLASGDPCGSQPTVSAVELRALIEECERWQDRDGVLVLKHNPLRTVLRIPPRVGCPALIVKRYHLRGAAERLKFRLWPTRALQEWRALRFLHGAGVSVPRVFAVGDLRQGGQVTGAALILEYIEASQPLARALTLGAQPAPTDAPSIPSVVPFAADARTHLLRLVGAEIGRLHQAGARHKDLHAGNILVRAATTSGGEEAGDKTSGSVRRVVLIDHHACRPGRRPGPQRRRQDLAKLVHSLTGLLSPGEEAALVVGYGEVCGADAAGLVGASLVHDLARRAARLEAVRVRSRSRRCWVDSSQFAAATTRRWRTHRRREVPLAALLDPLGHADGLAVKELLAARPHGRVYRSELALAHGPVAVVVKEQTYPRLIDRVTQALRGPHLLRAWGMARVLEVHRFPAARCLAVVVERRWLLPCRSWLIMQQEAHAMSLADWATRVHVPAERARLSRLLAEAVRRLHTLPIYHGDLSPRNLLVVSGDGADAGVDRGPGGEPAPDRVLLLDLDAVRACAPSGRRKQKNLVQLGHWPDGAVSPRERLRFLWHYERGPCRLTDRRRIAALEEALADLLVRTIGKLSRFERRTPVALTRP